MSQQADTVDVLLINLPVSIGQAKEIRRVLNSFPPIGLLYVATCLARQGIRVRVLDLAVSLIRRSDFLSTLRQLNPSVVGLSTYNESWQAQKVLARVIKDAAPETAIVAGGAFATFCYRDMFERAHTDYVIRGEGEYSFCSLCEHLIHARGGPLSSIPGLVYRDTSGSLRMNPVERIRHLDELPFPDLGLVNPADYTVGAALITARGCPGRCIFCSAKAFFGGKIYFRSADNILAELLDIYARHHATLFYFTDDTFTFHKKRAKEFCRKLIATGLPFSWGCESRADVLDDEELVDLLAQSGCTKMQIGLESGDNEVLRKLNKNLTVEQVERAVQLTRKAGIFVQTSYMIGHAFDTEETIRKTIGYARYLDQTYGTLSTPSINTPFPGTDQYERADEYGMQIHSSDWDEFRFTNPIISTRAFTREQIKEYFALANQ